ncbi:MAG: butyrate kinase, partial [Clostridia bacterium]|nr:butyrate kinase [Clostridia bacterium]
MVSYRVFAINPGSTSTKIALFEDETCLYSKTVDHDAKELAKYEDMPAQLPYRRDMILDLLKEDGISLEGVDVFVGRGGGLLPVKGGTYSVTDLILDHAKNIANGFVHPAVLGPQLAHEFAKTYGARAMVVNPPDVDEFQDLSRLTGIKGIYRESHMHALNLKETAIRHCKIVENRQYEDCNLVVCHIGGGISVSAHDHGRMIDGTDIAGGEGPMTPTRCGEVAVSGIIKYLETRGDLKSLKGLCSRKGGFIDHLGTSDAIEVTNRAKNGDKYAEMLWNTMIY